MARMEARSGYGGATEEAIEWVARLMSGAATDTELEAYAIWRQMCPLNAVAADQVLQTWNLAGIAVRPGGGLKGAKRRRPVGAGTGAFESPLAFYPSTPRRTLHFQPG